MNFKVGILNKESLKTLKAVCLTATLSDPKGSKHPNNNFSLFTPLISRRFSTKFKAERATLKF